MAKRSASFCSREFANNSMKSAVSREPAVEKMTQVVSCAARLIWWCAHARRSNNSPNKSVCQSYSQPVPISSSAAHTLIYMWGLCACMLTARTGRITSMTPTPRKPWPGAPLCKQFFVILPSWDSTSRQLPALARLHTFCSPRCYALSFVDNSWKQFLLLAFQNIYSTVSPTKQRCELILILILILAFLILLFYLFIAVVVVRAVCVMS